MKGMSKALCSLENARAEPATIARPSPIPVSAPSTDAASA